MASLNDIANEFIREEIEEYIEQPDEIERFIPKLLEAGAFFIGGCCGTTPAHIKAFRDEIDSSSSRTS